MEPNVSTLERAFHLAGTGLFSTVTEIKLRLAREGYRHEQVEGPELIKQLTSAIAEARAARLRPSKRKLSVA